MKTKLLLIIYFLLIANILYSNEASIYITHKNGKIDTLTFSNNSLFNVGIDSTTNSISFDPEHNILLSNPLELMIFPNPSETSMNICFNTDVSTNAIISVYNLEGKLIKTISMFTTVIGFNKLTWDCTDNDGKRIYPGIYFIELNNSEEKITKKVVLSK
jgi:hypothetical protein